MRRLRTLANRASFKGSGCRCGQLVRSGSIADNYRGFAIRLSSSASCSGLQSIGRATVDGSTAVPLSDGLVLGGVDEQLQSRSNRVARRELPAE